LMLDGGGAFNGARGHGPTTKLGVQVTVDGGTFDEEPSMGALLEAAPAAPPANRPGSPYLRMGERELLGWPNSFRTIF
jgi:hypothetical protein